MMTSVLPDIEDLQPESGGLRFELTGEGWQCIERQGKILYLEKRFFGKKSEEVNSCFDSKELYFEGLTAATEASTLTPLGSAFPAGTFVVEVPQEDNVRKETSAPLPRLVGESRTSWCLSSALCITFSIIRDLYARKTE